MAHKCLIDNYRNTLRSNEHMVRYIQLYKKELNDQYGEEESGEDEEEEEDEESDDNDYKDKSPEYASQQAAKDIDAAKKKLTIAAPENIYAGHKSQFPLVGPPASPKSIAYTGQEKYDRIKELYDDAVEKVEAAKDAVKKYNDFKSQTYFLQGAYLDPFKM